MWELIKNNPVIKIVLVLIVGIIGFGILFNILFGAGYGNYNMGHEGGMYGGYGGIGSATGVLVYLYSVFFKLLVFALVISFIALIIRFAYLYTSGKSETLIKNPLVDPYVKAASVLGISVLTLLIAAPILSGLLGVNLSQGMGGYGMRMVNGYGYNQYGYSSFNGSELIAVILKLFLILSVIGVLVGLTMFIIKNYSGLFSGSGTVNKCVSCGNKINNTAKFCPDCGQKQTTTNSQDVETEETVSVRTNSSSRTNKTKSNTMNDSNKNNSDVQTGTSPAV
jgi:hypothetical protein